jgi:hypothetical protein
VHPLTAQRSTHKQPFDRSDLPHAATLGPQQANGRQGNIKIRRVSVKKL